MPLALPDRMAPTSGVSFADDLERFGDRTALVAGGRQVSYGELARRVREVQERLGGERRLVLLRAAPTAESVAGYLAALRSRCPVLMVPAGQGGPAEAAVVDNLVRTYDPDVVLGHEPTGGSGDGSAAGPWAVTERRPGSAHTLHPQLALLLSTSGSTGSPKLVRLSHRNLVSNAESIATFLGIGPRDRAVTSLPLHYSYGLSVLHSHLHRGASVLLTQRSVTEPEFWRDVRETGVTSFAGVPYTFELLERTGFADLVLPQLRYVTSAGGRLEPDRARRFAALGRSRGWRLVLMYGQTEATARMAYLPPELTESHPYAVGVAIPGGRLRLDPVPDAAGPGCGELVYEGPNVMLGYAEGPADLALGRTVHELRTGDLGRVRDGLFEVTGRRSRIAKTFGVRVDLDHLERCLAAMGQAARCVAVGDEIVVAVRSAGEGAAAREEVTRRCGIPARMVGTVVLDPLPRLTNGKVDHAAVAAAYVAQRHGSVAVAAESTPAALRAVLAECLGHADVTDESSFAALGGDSLSYVEVSVRFEELLGGLPAGWHATPVRELAAGALVRAKNSTQDPTEHPADGAASAGTQDGTVRTAPEGSTTPRARRRFRALDTSVLLRAVAIVLVVGSHAQLFSVVGGAHLLLGVAGYNVARFQLASTNRARRVRNLLTGVRRVAVPTTTWVAAVSAVSALTGALPGYGIRTVLLLNGALGPRIWGPAWHYWFVECLVYVLVGLTLFLAVPAVHRLDLRHPFAVPLMVTCVALAARYGVPDGPVRIYSAPVLVWLFALGWSAARATTAARRVVVSALVVATVPGFFADPAREALVVAGLLLLTWVHTVPVPAVCARPVALVASGSLYVYLTHWQVFPPIAGHSRALAVAASVAAGVTVWRLSEALGGALARATAWLRRAAPRLRVGRPETTAHRARTASPRRAPGLRRRTAGRSPA